MNKIENFIHSGVSGCLGVGGSGSMKNCNTCGAAFLMEGWRNKWSWRKG